MFVFSLRLIGQTGEVCLQEKMKTTTFPKLWKLLAEVAEDFGQPGDILQVLDERDQIIIHVGVATAQERLQRPHQAA